MAVDGPQRPLKKRILKDWLRTKNPLTKDADGDGSAADLWIVFITTSAGIFSMPTSQMTTGRHNLDGHP